MTILFSKPNLFLILPIVALRSGNLSFKKQYKTIWYYNEIYWVSPLSFCIVYNCWARAHGWWHDSGLLIFTAPQIVFFCLFSKKKGRIFTKCNICSLKTIYWIHYVHRLSRRIEFSANNKTVANDYFLWEGCFNISGQFSLWMYIVRVHQDWVIFCPYWTIWLPGGEWLLLSQKLAKIYDDGCHCPASLERLHNCFVTTEPPSWEWLYSSRIILSKGKKSRVSRGAPLIDQIRKIVPDGSPYPILVLQKQDTETEMVTHKIRILK